MRGPICLGKVSSLTVAGSFNFGGTDVAKATTYIFGPYLWYFGNFGLAPGDSVGGFYHSYYNNAGQLIRDNFTVTFTGHPGTGQPDRLGSRQVIQTLTILDLRVQNVPEPGVPGLYQPIIGFTVLNSGFNTMRDCELYLTLVQQD
jgi:hypothetical protein